MIVLVRDSVHFLIIKYNKIVHRFAELAGSSDFCMTCQVPENLPNFVGWKNRKTLNLMSSAQDIILQGQCLCGQYIRARLKRAGMLNRKALQRLRTVIDIPSSAIVRDVFPALNGMGEELERMHPRIYNNVARQLSCSPFGELQEADTAPLLLSAVARDLFKTDITWGKIISFFAVTGGLAADCVRQGHYDYLHRLIEVTANVIEQDLIHWLADNGGWLGLLEHIIQPDCAEYSMMGWLSIAVVLLSAIYLTYCVIESIGNHLYSFLF